MFDILSSSLKHPIYNYENELYNNIRYTQLYMKYNELLHKNIKDINIIKNLKIKNLKLKEENENILNVLDKYISLKEKHNILLNKYEFIKNKKDLIDDKEDFVKL